MVDFLCVLMNTRLDETHVHVHVHLHVHVNVHVQIDLFRLACTLTQSLLHIQVLFRAHVLKKIPPKQPGLLDRKVNTEKRPKRGTRTYTHTHIQKHKH